MPKKTGFLLLALLLLVPAFAHAFTLNLQVVGGDATHYVTIGANSAQLKTGTTTYYPSSLAANMIKVFGAGATVTLDGGGFDPVTQTITAPVAPATSRNVKVVYQAGILYNVSVGAQPSGGYVYVQAVDGTGKGLSGTVTSLTGLAGTTNVKVSVYPNSAYKVTGITCNGASKSLTPASPVAGQVTTFTGTAQELSAGPVTATVAGDYTLTAKLYASPTSVAAGNTVTLTTSGTTTNDTAIADYAFSFIAGPTPYPGISANGGTATFSAPASGTYTVQVIATSTNGKTGTATATFSVISARDASVNACTSCHYNRNPQIVTEYTASGHATNSHGPTCANCHTADGTAAGHDVSLNTTAKCESCHKPATDLGSTYFSASAYRAHWNNFSSLYGAKYTNRNQCADCHNGHDPVTSFKNTGLYSTYAEQGHANTVTANNPTKTNVRGQWRRGSATNDINGSSRNCSVCHLQDGLLTYVGAPNKEATVNNSYSGYYMAAAGAANYSILGCAACHTDAIGTIRTLPAVKIYSNFSVAKSNVAGKGPKKFANNFTLPDAKSSNVCNVCHAGSGESATSGSTVALIVANYGNMSSANIAVPGSHQMTAAQTLYGKAFTANVPHAHQTIGLGTGETAGPCAGCHNLNSTNHSWEAVNASGTVTNNALCSTCHVSNFNVEEAKTTYLNSLSILKQILYNNGFKMKTGSFSFGNMTGHWGAQGWRYGVAFDMNALNSDAGAFAHNPAYVAKIMNDAIVKATGKTAAAAIAEITALTYPGAPATLVDGKTVAEATKAMTSMLTLSEKHVSSLPATSYRVQYLTGSNTCGSCHSPQGESPLQVAAREAWAESAHGEITAAAWTPSSTHAWRNAGATLPFNTNIPKNDCQRCHSVDGFIQIVGSNFTNLTPVADATGGKLNSPLACNACHTSQLDASNTRRAVPAVVTYYNISTAQAGKTGLTSHIRATFPDVGDSNICNACHTGKITGQNLVDIFNKGADFSNLGFQNPHYLAASATMYVKGGFTAFSSATGTLNYAGGRTVATYAKTLVSNLDDVPGYPAGTKGTVSSTHRLLGTAGDLTHGITPNTKLNTGGPCVTCHMQGTNSGTAIDHRADGGHSLEINQDAISQVCNTCHASELGQDITTIANFKQHFLEPQSEAYQAALTLAKKVLKTQYHITYSDGYPYFYDDDDANKAVTNWTRPSLATPLTQLQAMRLHGAAYNLKLLSSDSAAYAHARTYSRRLVFDTIDYLDDLQLNNSVAATALATDAVTFAKGDHAFTGAADAAGTAIYSGTAEGMLYLIGWDRNTGKWNSETAGKSDRP